MIEKLYCYVDESGQETLGNLFYVAIYHHTKAYLPLTLQTISRTIQVHTRAPYKATILIDGLSRAQQTGVGSALRRLGIHTRKVRGVRKEENDALTRLADALCGFIRDALEGQATFQDLVEKRRKSGYLQVIEEQ